MPIKIDYTPVAALGGAAILAGQGQYKRWLDEMQQRWNMQQANIAAQQQAQQERFAFEQMDRERQREWQTARDMWQARNEDYRAGRDYDWRRDDRESDQKFRWDMAGEQENWRSAEADKERNWRKAEFDRKARMESTGAYFPELPPEGQGEGWIPDDPLPEWDYTPPDRKRLEAILAKKAQIESDKDLDETEKAVAIKSLSDEASKIKPVKRELSPQEYIQRYSTVDAQGNTIIVNPKTGQAQVVRDYEHDERREFQRQQAIAKEARELWQQDQLELPERRRYATPEEAYREAERFFPPLKPDQVKQNAQAVEQAYGSTGAARLSGANPEMAQSIADQAGATPPREVYQQAAAEANVSPEQVDAAAFAIRMARIAGITDRNKLRQIGEAAIRAAASKSPAQASANAEMNAGAY